MNYDPLKKRILAGESVEEFIYNISPSSFLQDGGPFAFAADTVRRFAGKHKKVDKWVRRMRRRGQVSPYFEWVEEELFKGDNQ